MPLSHGYGVLKGRAVKRQMEREDTQSPHFQVLVKDDRESYRLAINVKSVQAPVDLLYLVQDNFNHPITNQLKGLGLGFHTIPQAERKAGGIALDYIRGNLFDPKQMKPLPADAPGREDDLHDILDVYIQRSLNNSEADLYVFGEPFGPEPQADKIFGFRPGRGVHNIHMNQGSSGRFGQENGIYQDGGLLIHFRDRNQWVAAFFAFQSQAFHTDDRTGNPVNIQVGTEPELPQSSAITADIQIVAALVNPPGADPGKETVTLLNTTAHPIDLGGWALADQLKRKHLLQGTIAADSAIRVNLSGADIQLGNQGGILTLLNPQGIKVDGIAYTKTDAQQQGRTIVF
jgi:uncharacterized protein YukJ